MISDIPHMVGDASGAADPVQEDEKPGTILDLKLTLLSADPEKTMIALQGTGWS